MSGPPPPPAMTSKFESLFAPREYKPPPPLILETINFNPSKVTLEMIEEFFEERKKPKNSRKKFWMKKE
jgi:hypothetical protein